MAARILNRGISMSSEQEIVSPDKRLIRFSFPGDVQITAYRSGNSPYKTDDSHSDLGQLTFDVFNSYEVDDWLLSQLSSDNLPKSKPIQRSIKSVETTGFGDDDGTKAYVLNEPIEIEVNVDFLVSQDIFSRLESIEADKYLSFRDTMFAIVLGTPTYGDVYKDGWSFEGRLDGIAFSSIYPDWRDEVFLLVEFSTELLTSYGMDRSWSVGDFQMSLATDQKTKMYALGTS